MQTPLVVPLCALVYIHPQYACVCGCLYASSDANFENVLVFLLLYQYLPFFKLIFGLRLSAFCCQLPVDLTPSAAVRTFTNMRWVMVDKLKIKCLFILATPQFDVDVFFHSASLSFPRVMQQSRYLFLRSSFSLTVISLFSYKYNSMNLNFQLNILPILHTVFQHFQQLFITVPGSSAPNSISPLLPLALAIFRLRRTQYLSHFICRGISWRPAPFGGINASLKALTDQLQSPLSRAVVLGWPAVERHTHSSALRSRFPVSTVYQLSTDTADCVTVSPTVAQSVRLSVSLSVCLSLFLYAACSCICVFVCAFVCRSL